MTEQLGLWGPKPKPATPTDVVRTPVEERTVRWPLHPYTVVPGEDQIAGYHWYFRAMHAAALELTDADGRPRQHVSAERSEKTLTT